MATIVREWDVACLPSAAWASVSDIGALHTRLVPGFVIDTKLEKGARIVTFANGAVVREPIVTLDEAANRLVWTAEGALTTHYNAALQVFSAPTGRTRLVWTVDFLPESARPALERAMDAGVAAIVSALGAVVADGQPAVR
jgi:hypothetical protein